MPLTRGEGRVTGLAEGVGPGLMLHQFLVDLGERPTGKQHRTRRHARRPLVATLHVGPVERHATLHEAIEVRSLDDRITQGRDGIGALVVGEDEDDVGRRRGTQ